MIWFGPLNQIGLRCHRLLKMCSREGGSPDWIPAFAGKQGESVMAVMTAQISVSLPKGLKAQLRAKAQRRGISLSALMREISGFQAVDGESAR